MNISNIMSSMAGNYMTSKSRESRAPSAAPIAAQPPAETPSSNYDFTNMTPSQMQSAMNDLIASGRMTFNESSSLVGMVPTALSKVSYDGQAPDAYSQPKNFINDLTLGIKGAESRGDAQNAQNLKASLAALMRLQDSAPSAKSINLTA